MRMIMTAIVMVAVCTRCVSANDPVPVDVRRASGTVKTPASSAPSADSAAVEPAATLDDALVGFRQLADQKRPFAAKFEAHLEDLLKRVEAALDQKPPAPTASFVAVKQNEFPGIPVARAAIAAIAQAACELGARLEALANGPDDRVFLTESTVDIITAETKGIVHALAGLTRSSDPVVALTATESER